MFPGQQCATCPAQLWPPRLGIKLLEGVPSTEKCGKGVYFRIASRKIGALSLVFAQSVENAKVVISTLPPLYTVWTRETWYVYTDLYTCAASRSPFAFHSPYGYCMRYSIWYSGMRHTGATQTRMTRDAHTRCHTNMVNNKREIYNKLPASRAGRKRHFRRYPPPPPAVVILPRAGPRAAAWGRGWWQLKRRRGCSRSQPRCACPCPWPLPPWPAPGWGEGQVEGYG